MSAVGPTNAAPAVDREEETVPAATPTNAAATPGREDDAVPAATPTNAAATPGREEEAAPVATPANAAATEEEAVSVATPATVAATPGREEEASPVATPTNAAPALDHEEQIVPDENPFDDTASERGESTSESTQSVTASIFNYRQENGRTYHAYKDGKYTLPNDEREIDRLDLQHNLFLITFDDRLGNAPPNDPGAKVGRVLDVGTGTGIWACEFGDEHPEAEVLGFDLSATFPSFTPPNVKFEVDDLEEPWIYSRKFDYIHSRMMNGCIADWDAYARKCFDNLNPGGWLEINEISLMPKSDDGTLKDDAMIFKMAKLVREATIQFGRVATDMEDIKEVLIRAGYVDVRVLKFKWPTNMWPKDARYKEIAKWSQENILAGWEPLCLATITRAHGWTKEEVLVGTMHCRNEFNDRSIHAYYPVVSSSNVSLAADVMDYRMENGRTYHGYKEGKYNLPNDETENDRLELQHNLFLLTFNDQLGNAPPNNKDAKVGRVLDIGTGTGLWAVDFGDEHPEAEVLGVDLSATFINPPPNVSFEVDDIEEPWTYFLKFDYIHSRMMNGCINDWEEYAAKCFDNLSPGGWVEFIETPLKPQSDDGTLPEDAQILVIADLIQEASEKAGRPTMKPDKFQSILSRAGFVDIKVLKYKWPTNAWPRTRRFKEIGTWSHENIVSGWDGLCLTILTRAYGWTKEEVDVSNELCRREFMDKTIHAYWPLYSVYGRKPLDAE
ncbi:putative methyltransferase tdiE [Colletotrichum gloeosporioides]|uniref:Putative methyltransferase tdiE n=1 Tax=Colletotrichum gloeosporioides TaxID=474922 RepID=A0A8H4CMR4_COLGL|nr:putative methyltransferase tdiE [Colletotrichum gloeosporioides]KAF3806833.1 putative methyltransferase tdiE [Colletotrichum gloeosporioides]